MKKFIKILLAVLAVLILLAVGFICYLQFSYYRIGDTDLPISNNQSEKLSLGKEYSITTYNIGFGAYDRDYSFFMDKGYMEDGTETVGKYGKGVSKENVLKNTMGSIEILKSLSSDFLILQEVDTDSSRSYGINQKEMLTSTLGDFGFTYASNFHSGYLPYPITDMHGIANSGILTMSKYNMASSKRIELPIDESFFNKFFDLDRCINIVRYEVEGSDKMLSVISVHLSAYDEGGVIRKQQMELLKGLMQEEYDKGNYVIVGGDYNHVIGGTDTTFPTKQLRPDWIQTIEEGEFGDNFKIVADLTAPTCRGADIPWEEGVTYATVIDGFIVSDNVEIVSVKCITQINGNDTNFLYSDHNPVNMKFILK